MTLPEPKNPEGFGPLFGWPRRRTIMSCQRKNGPLLVRYFLFRTRWISVYLHHLIGSDEDRALHDHPWSFVTFLLTGGYWEITPAGRFWRHWLSVLYRPAEWSHRLELTRPVWTLVFRWSRRREWGFWETMRVCGKDWKRWVQWQAYGKEWCD